MKKTVLLFLLIAGFSIHSFGQQDLYHWRLSASANLAHYNGAGLVFENFRRVNNNFIYNLGIETELGYTFGIALSAYTGKIQGESRPEHAFVNKINGADLRLYFYTDNGWLFPKNSFLSPYLFGGYGIAYVKPNADNEYFESENQISTIPFGGGFKLRLSERWNLNFVATENYPLQNPLSDGFKMQNDQHNAFLQGGVVVAYNFGFRKSHFNAPTYFIGDDERAYQGSTRSGYIDRTNLPMWDSLRKLKNVPSDTLQVADIEDPELSFIQVPEGDTVNPSRIQTAAPQNEQNAPGSDKYSLQSFQENIRDRDTQSIQMDDQPTVTRNPFRDTITVYKEVLIERDRSENQFNHGARQEPSQPQIIYREQPSRSQPDNNSFRPIINAVPGRSVVVNNSDQAQDIRGLRMAIDSLAMQNRMILQHYNPGQPVNSDGFHQQVSINPSSNETTETENFLRAENQLLMARNAGLQQSLNEKDALMRQSNELAMLRDSISKLNQQIGQRHSTKPVIASAPAFEAITVYYPNGSTAIPSASETELLQIASRLKTDKSLTAMVAGYSDRSGNPKINLIVSRKRAEAVSLWLQKHGVAKRQIALQYYGDTKGPPRQIIAMIVK